MKLVETNNPRGKYTLFDGGLVYSHYNKVQDAVKDIERMKRQYEEELANAEEELASLDEALDSLPS